MGMEWDVQEAWRLRQSGLEWAQVGAPFGLSADVVRLRVTRYCEREGVGQSDAPYEQMSVRETSTGNLVAQIDRSRRIQTLDQLIEAAEIDLDQWEPYLPKVKSWQGYAKVNGELTTEQLFAVSCSFRPLKPLVDAKAIIAALAEDMKAHAPRYKKPIYPKVTDPHLLEVCIADHHFGLLAWGEECGDDYDSDLADAILDRALDDLLAYATRFEVEQILIPLGNDWMHTDQTVDGKGGATTAGTQQDVDTRWQKMYRRAVKAAVRMIERLRAIAPVEVVIIPGNHDRERMFTLGMVLEAQFSRDDAVTIRNEVAPRHYVRYGNTLIGIAHGDSEKPKDLPVIMATEAPGDWAATSHREWHTAHTHGKRETQYVAVDEDHGIRIRVMPSMVARDSWHAAKGYRHKRAAECYLFHRERDYVGHFSANVPPELRMN